MFKVGLICASDEELAPFLPHIENCVITEKAMLTLYEGSIGGLSVVILYSGVCKVNAAIAAQILIDIYCVNTIISAGVAGGMDAEIRLFDTVISSEVAYHDVEDDILTEFHPWLPTIYFHTDENLLEIATAICNEDKTVHLGRMVTGEKFIKDNMREDIIKKYSPLSVDMESASIAHVCFVNKVPFISIRSISDTAAHSGNEAFEENCAKASVIAKNIVLIFLERLKTRYVK